MISKKYRVLETIDGVQYVFSPFAFKEQIKRYVKKMKLSGQNITAESVKADLEEKYGISADAIKNWMYGYNGPADVGVVRTVAEYLGIDYKELLLKKETEDMERRLDSVKSAPEVVYVTGESKDAVRRIYQKMSEFMEIVNDTCMFRNATDKEHYAYVEFHKELDELVRYSLLDIPKDVYEELKKIVSDFQDFIYGGYDEEEVFYEKEHAPEEVQEFWDLEGCEMFSIFRDEPYKAFCESEKLDSSTYNAHRKYVDKLYDEFYQHIRHSLARYIPA